MDEFGSQLDGMIRIGVVLGEDAAADAVAGFEDLDMEPGAGQVEGGGKAGCAST